MPRVQKFEDLNELLALAYQAHVSAANQDDPRYWHARLLKRSGR